GNLDDEVPPGSDLEQGPDAPCGPKRPERPKEVEEADRALAQVALLPGLQLDHEVLLERAAFAEKSAIGKRAEPIEVSLDGGDAPFEAIAIELLVVRGRDRGRGW